MSWSPVLALVRVAMMRVLQDLSAARSPILMRWLCAPWRPRTVAAGPLPRHADDDLVGAFLSLPIRSYLDTSTLQTMFDYGGELWAGEPVVLAGRAAWGARLGRRDPYACFMVNERAQFEFVVTEASQREVVNRDQPTYTQWVRDVEDTWLIQFADERHCPVSSGIFNEPRLGNISVKDRRLLQSALDYQCDTFLTMERRLPTAAAFVERTTRLRIMRPSTFWRLLSPWAALCM